MEIRVVSVENKVNKMNIKLLLTATLDVYQTFISVEYVLLLY